MVDYFYLYNNNKMKVQYLRMNKIKMEIIIYSIISLLFKDSIKESLSIFRLLELRSSKIISGGGENKILSIFKLIPSQNKCLKLIHLLIILTPLLSTFNYHLIFSTIGLVLKLCLIMWVCGEHFGVFFLLSLLCFSWVITERNFTRRTQNGRISRK